VHAEICRQKTPPGFTFTSKMDSSGSDIGKLATGAGNWTALGEACAANPYCQGINTNAWWKYAIKPQAQWSSSYSDVCAGLLVKQGEWFRVMSACERCIALATCKGFIQPTTANI
jgi:hypothetical protein